LRRSIISTGSGNIIFVFGSEDKSTKVYKVLKYKASFDFPKISAALTKFSAALISPSDFENGKIIKNKNSDTFEIVLNGSVKDEEKQRFLIAHELGHLFFHMPFFDKNENWKEYKGVFHDSATSRANWAVQEVEADLFSNYLLMPLDKLENSLSNASSEDGIDISIVADEFKISKNKLLNYALDYNLIKYVDA